MIPIESSNVTLKRFPFNVGIDWWLLFATGLLLVGGLMAQYSFAVGQRNDTEFRKQIIDIAIGIVPMVLLLAIKPRTWIKASWLFYAINIGVLVLVLALGKDANGSQRWLRIGPVEFQPSELSKLLIIMTIGAFFYNRHDVIDRWRTFAGSFLHILPPLILILLQPHLGAAIVLIMTWLAMCVAVGIPWKYLGSSMLALAIIAGLLLTVPAIQDKLLHGYQRSRITALVDHGGHNKGSNYQTRRAEIAFGSGGVAGEGFLRGTQKQGHFIPDQDTDFIFTIVGEEGGLIGCSIVLLVFALFFMRIYKAIISSSEIYERALCAGVFAMLLFHTFVNISMVLHILPVVGLWLPFFSYGGSAMWLCLASTGLVLGVYRSQRPDLFKN